MIDFGKLNTSRADCLLMAKIASRANHSGINRDRIDLIMDLEVAHADAPMDLDGLLDASEIDFRHDVIGIVNSLNRETGHLEHGFVPRYAKCQ